MSLTEEQLRIYNADPLTLSKDDLLRQFSYSYHQIPYDLGVAAKRADRVKTVWMERFPEVKFWD